MTTAVETVCVKVPSDSTIEFLGSIAIRLVI